MIRKLIFKVRYNLPPFAYSLRFWDGVSMILAGLAAVLIYFGVLPESYAYPAAAILAGIKAILKFFGVNPELISRGII